MNTIKSTTANSTTTNTKPSLSPKEIERLIDRGGRLLRAAGTKPAIMRDMLEVGYNLEEHHHGWELYLKLCGYNPVLPVEVHSAADAAMQKIDGWDGRAFLRSGAALGRCFPAQNELLFAGLEAKTGIASVASCKTYLDRLAIMRQGSDDDRAAVALLEQRGIISPTIEKELRDLIDQAMQLTDVPKTDDTRERELQAAAHEFKAWLDDWRTTAAATITRRDHLISLGLASRRTSSTDEEPADPAEAPTDATDATITEPASPAPTV